MCRKELKCAAMEVMPPPVAWRTREMMSQVTGDDFLMGLMDAAPH